MRNLYVVAIGGSGERVMRSLIMLLASGVKVDADRVVPVFIENDITSHALQSCMKLLEYYSNPESGVNKGIGVNTIYNKLGADSTKWPSFCKTVIAEPMTLNQAGDSIGNLAAVIGNYDSSKPIYDRIDEERNLLFTPDDLSMKLTVGFVGNPNIGSVVLNSLSLNDERFGNLKTALSPQDGLIVVGSLFGGTGAAGIPLVVNSINEMSPQRRPVLGTVALLPYYVTNPNDDKTGNIIDTTKYNVQSDAFDAKTRAALMYYADYMTTMDWMYYVGDSKAKDVYPHCIGGPKQNNRAHLVELMGALSIVDFSKQQRGNSTNYKRPVWGVNNDGDTHKLPTNLSGVCNHDLAEALVKFRMMMQIFKDSDFLQDSISEKQQYAENIGFTEPMRGNVVIPKNADNSVHTWGLNNMLQEWENWMNELGDENAKRMFKIYDDNQEANDKNLISKFYTESDFGIAKSEMKGLFKKTEVALESGVKEALAQAYKTLYPNGKKEDAFGYSDDERLPRLLQIISMALDKVIKDRCIAL